MRFHIDTIYRWLTEADTGQHSCRILNEDAFLIGWKIV